MHPFSALSLSLLSLSLFSLCASRGTKSSLFRERERGREGGPVPHHDRHHRHHRVAGFCQPPKVVKYSADVFHPSSPSPCRFTLASAPRVHGRGPLLRIRYVNREDDNRTETTDESRAGALEREGPPPPLPFTFSSTFHRIDTLFPRDRHLDRSSVP